MRRRIPDVLDQGEQARLLDPLRDSEAPTKVRNLALLRLMLASGLRVSEALTLRRQDLDLTTGRLTVRQGKGGKDRILWINGGALAAVELWLNLARISGDRLFTTMAGKPMSRRYMVALLHRLADQAGIRKRIHPHTLRHTCATELLRQTKNLRLVQHALGHANLSTTQIYTHIVDEELESAMKGLRIGR